MLVRQIVIAIAMLACASQANAHGIAGNRFFVGTLTIDDPAVADEAILPGYTGLGHPSEAGDVLDNRIDGHWSLVGYHDDGGLKPTRFESYAAFQKRTASR
jgi:hypothetical protein